MEKECALLSRFLVISFADLKKWRFYYSVAFPALVLDPPANVVDLRPASEWLSLKEVCKTWSPFYILDLMLVIFDIRMIGILGRVSVSCLQ